MKTHILLTGILLLSIAAVPASSQSSYYDRTKIIEIGDGSTYKCDNDGMLVTLYNSDNAYTYTEMTYKGGRLPEFLNSTAYSSLNITEFGHNCIQSIVNSAFSSAQKKVLKGELLTVTLIIDPGYEVARLLEVNFDFFAISPFSQIPPSVFRDIEVSMKSQWAQLSQTVEPFAYVTEIGRDLNFVILSWQHEVK